MRDRVKVLFVCVHNEARSRMAEALLRHLGGPRFEVASAGFEPHAISPLVAEALAAIDIRLPGEGLQPSVFDLFRSGWHFQYVIAVCDESRQERCPIFPAPSERLTWSFPDPGTFRGTHAEQLAQVIQLLDAMRARIEAWLATTFPERTTESPGH